MASASVNGQSALQSPAIVMLGWTEMDVMEYLVRQIEDEESQSFNTIEWLHRELSMSIAGWRGSARTRSCKNQ